MKEEKFIVRINDKNEFEVTEQELQDLDIRLNGDEQAHLVHNGQSYSVTLKKFDTNSKMVELEINGALYHVKIKDRLDQLIDAMGMKAMLKKTSDDVMAPMPGLVLKLMVKEGDQLEAGQPVLILEAMKMENVLKTDGAGTVKKININVGETVDKGQTLIQIQPPE